MRRLALALTLCIGCRGGEPSAPAPSAPTPSAPRSTPTPGAPRTSESVDPRVSALLADWERAQDAGDFARYASLYAERFTGVRRSGPRTRSFDRTGWLEDRKRMFQRPMQVDFTRVSVSSAGASVLVRGEQHFKSGSYEDRGPKRLVLSREAGSYRIAREEMLASELAPPPVLAARFVVQAGTGPGLVLLAPAAGEPPTGAPRAVYPGATAALLYDAPAGEPPPEARVFEGAQSVQVVGAEGVCTAGVLGLRRARVVLPHFGTVESWRGGDPERPQKPSSADLAQEIDGLGPASFWALELTGPCRYTGAQLAVAAGVKISLAQRDEPSGADADALRKAFAALPQVRALPSAERTDALAALSLARYQLGERALATVDTPADCSTTPVHASFALTPAPRLESVRSEAGLGSVQLAADLDGDGELELVGTSAVGFGELFVTDRAGKALLTLSLPYLDCPC